MYMENAYSTLALGKEREIVKEEAALRKEKEAVCCYVHVDVHVHLCTCISCTCTGKSRVLAKPGKPPALVAI